jgi:hypothetical protein
MNLKKNSFPPPVPFLHIASPSPDGLTLRAFSKALSCFPAFDVVAKIPAEVLATAAFGCAQKSQNES